MLALAAALARFTVLVAPSAAQEVTEPHSSVRFAAKRGDLSLLGVGLRTRTVFNVKVYAIGLYVADSALSGPLAVHKGALGTPSFYKDLVTGDFAKEVHLRSSATWTRAPSRRQCATGSPGPTEPGPRPSSVTSPN